METRIIISQIFILAVVVLIGAIAAKFKVLTKESKDMLSKVIFNISQSTQIVHRANITQSKQVNRNC